MYQRPEEGYKLRRSKSMWHPYDATDLPIMVFTHDPKKAFAKLNEIIKKEKIETLGIIRTGWQEITIDFIGDPRRGSWSLGIEEEEDDPEGIAHMFYEVCYRVYNADHNEYRELTWHYSNGQWKLFFKSISRR